MSETAEKSGNAPRFEVHDPEVLRTARKLIESCPSPSAMQAEVVAAVQRNQRWRGEQCLNLLAPEAPTSATVRSLLAAEIGTTAAEGHIGPGSRWFAGTRHIDEVESLCVELLKRLFRCNYAEHRLCASMIGNLAVYTALTQPGDTIMSLSQPVGGHSSNRVDGPAGVRGLRIVDIPVDPEDLSVDLEAFSAAARAERPVLVALGASMTLFPYPVSEMAQVVAEWGGKVFFDGAHQLGLIAGGQFQDPLREGAAVLTGSGGKTFCGPQSGVMVWNDESLTGPLGEAVFPTLAATHQVNRVAALAAAACELLAFAQPLMAQIVGNARALAAALDERGVPVLGSHRGYTQTHQVIADVSALGGGLEAAQQLARANIITNKNLLPWDRREDWDHPSGLRLGTTEVTRYGMGQEQMTEIAELIASVLVRQEAPESVAPRAQSLRESFPHLGYCFD